jgi:hypothetical protein
MGDVKKQKERGAGLRSVSSQGVTAATYNTLTLDQPRRIHDGYSVARTPKVYNG